MVGPLCISLPRKKHRPSQAPSHHRRLLSAQSAGGAEFGLESLRNRLQRREAVAGLNLMNALATGIEMAHHREHPDPTLIYGLYTHAVGATHLVWAIRLDRAIKQHRITPADTAVRVSHDGAIANVTINNQKRRNAMSPNIIKPAFASLNNSADCRAIVLTGATGVFSSDGDTTTLGKGTPMENHRRFEKLAALARLVIASPKPMVASV